MKLVKVKLVTIIAKRKLREDITELLRSEGVSGYTVYDVLGNRSASVGNKSGEDDGNVQFSVLTEPLLAGAVMKDISDRYFGKEKVIVFEQEAKVIREQKFKKTIWNDTRIL